MHLIDGVVSAPVLIPASAAAAAGVAYGMKKIEPEDVPKIALLAAAFFVASTVRVPIGPAAAHLMLTGLLGMILGAAIFPALLAGLLMQMLVFGFGGISVLGLNLLNMALPGYVAYLLFTPLLAGWAQRGGDRKTLMRQEAINFNSGFFTALNSRSTRVMICGALAGCFALAGSAFMVAGSLALSGQEFIPAAKFILLSHVPVIVVEGLVVGAAVSLLHKVKPELFATAGFAPVRFAGEQEAEQQLC